MKFTLTVISIGIAAFLIQSVAPWWFGLFPAGIAVIIVHFKPGKAFLAGFLGVGLAWAIEATVIDILNDGVMSARIGEMFGSLPGWSMIVITAITGALLGGLGSITASLGVRWLVAK